MNGTKQTKQKVKKNVRLKPAPKNCPSPSSNARQLYLSIPSYTRGCKCPDCIAQLLGRGEKEEKNCLEYVYHLGYCCVHPVNRNNIIYL